MVIGPSELIKKIEENEKDKIQRIEETIDRHLTTKYNGGNMAIINYTSEMKEVRRFVLENTLDKYVQAGWTSVKIHHDQRDGSWIEFTYKA